MYPKFQLSREGFNCMQWHHHTHRLSTKLKFLDLYQLHQCCKVVNSVTPNPPNLQSLYGSLSLGNCKILAFKISFNPSRPDPERREKISLKFYFHTCLKAFIRPSLRHHKEV